MCTGERAPAAAHHCPCLRMHIAVQHSEHRTLRGRSLRPTTLMTPRLHSRHSALNPRQGCTARAQPHAGDEVCGTQRVFLSFKTAFAHLTAVDRALHVTGPCGVELPSAPAGTPADHVRALWCFPGVYTVTCSLVQARLPFHRTCIWAHCLCCSSTLSSLTSVLVLLVDASQRLNPLCSSAEPSRLSLAAARARQPPR